MESTSEQRGVIDAEDTTYTLIHVAALVYWQYSRAIISVDIKGISNVHHTNNYNVC